MNENINEATNQTNNSSTPIKGKAVHSFMTPKKQTIEEVPINVDVINGASAQDNADAEKQGKIIEPSIVTVPQIPESKTKDTNRKKRTTTVDYSELFLGRYELDSRQGLHVEKETIATIKRIVHSIGDPRLTVSGFVENVLKHHFEIYKEEINSLFEGKLRKPID